MRAAVFARGTICEPGYSFNDGEAYEQFMGRWSREIGKPSSLGCNHLRERIGSTSAVAPEYSRS